MYGSSYIVLANIACTKECKLVEKYGQKKGSGLHELTFLIHFVQLHNKVKEGYKCIALKVLYVFL